MSRFGIALLFGLVIGSVLAGCVDYTSNTDLDDNGPPAIAEVRLVEDWTGAGGMAEPPRTVFAYGSFPGATADDEHAVTTASVVLQKFRIIMDQLLRGNRLQQIQCRDNINFDENGQPSPWGNVPDDATPVDIAKCAVSDAALPLSCIGDNLVCICDIPGGCGSVALGAPVGVLDSNMDGAADATRFMPNAVTVVCGSDDSIVVPTDLVNSYWNPSGDQQVPAEGGYDALGPAIVLLTAGQYLPTNTTCSVKFAPTVISKANQEVCAPQGGRPASCTGRLDDCPDYYSTCVQGDTHYFSFGTDVLVIISSLAEGSTDESLTAPLYFTASAPLLLSSLSNITIAPAVPDMQISLNSTQLTFTFPTGLQPSTLYTITFPTTVTDSFGQGLPQPFVLTFTTAAM